MPEPTIRRATIDDAEALAAIGASTFIETFGHLYPPEDLETYLAKAYGLDPTRADLAKADNAVWLAEQDGAVIGYALAGRCGLPHPEVTPDCGELKRIYLAKSAQNGGLGGRLFTLASDWLQKDGPRSVWIGVWSENLGAQRLYARHGYVKVGEYGFHVGNTVDLEFILRRTADEFSRDSSKSAPNEHNPA